MGLKLPPGMFVSVPENVTIIHGKVISRKHLRHFKVSWNSLDCRGCDGTWSSALYDVRRKQYWGWAQSGKLVVVWSAQSPDDILRSLAPRPETGTLIEGKGVHITYRHYEVTYSYGDAQKVISCDNAKYDLDRGVYWQKVAPGTTVYWRGSIPKGLSKDQSIV